MDNSAPCFLHPSAIGPLLHLEGAIRSFTIIHCPFSILNLQRVRPWKSYVAVTVLVESLFTPGKWITLLLSLLFWLFVVGISDGVLEFVFLRAAPSIMRSIFR